MCYIYRDLAIMYTNENWFVIPLVVDILETEFPKYLTLNSTTQNSDWVSESGKTGHIYFVYSSSFMFKINFVLLLYFKV